MTSFKNTGKNVQEEQRRNRSVDRSTREDVLPIGIKMPLEKGQASYESLFKMNTNVRKQVSNNYKTFLLTKKGELLCKPDFGTIISSIYNRTDLTSEQMEEIIMEDISAGTLKYFPFVSLIDFESKEITSESKVDANYTKISIRYSIEGFEDDKNSIELMIRRSI
jgi:hypothetical protein